MTILHVKSSARFGESNSRKTGEYLVSKLTESTNDTVIERDLVAQPLPTLSAEDLVGVHGSHDASSRESLARHLEVSEELIDELNRADTLVIELAMYNFSVPFYLKQWIDYICRAGVTFRYTENGPEGLTGVKRAYLVTATGGTPVGGVADFASTYVEHICRFLGIEEVNHIDAAGSKRAADQVTSNAFSQVDSLVRQSL